MTAAYSAFEQPEYDVRLGQARAGMQKNNLAAIVVVAPENMFYISGYDSWVSVNSPQALIITSDDSAPPTLILRDVDLPLAFETTWVQDIRTYDLIREDFAERVTGILHEKGISKGRIGLEQASYALPMALGDRIRETLLPMEVVDSTGFLGDLRHIKSSAEMVYMEQAANHANAGLSALVAHTREGVTEQEIATEIELAMRRSGSDYWAIPMELSSGSRSAGGHATPRNKPVQSGDLVHAEFAGVAARYHTTAIQTVSCGEPSPGARELYDIGIASLKAGMDAVETGVSVSAVEEASLQPLRTHGLEAAAMMRFGYGIGIAYPPIWLETLQIARGFDYIMRPGMTFALHSCLELTNENLGIIQGGTWVLAETGLRLLAGAGACDLLVL